MNWKTSDNYTMRHGFAGGEVRRYLRLLRFAETQQERGLLRKAKEHARHAWREALSLERKGAQ